MPLGRMPKVLLTVGSVSYPDQSKALSYFLVSGRFGLYFYLLRFLFIYFFKESDQICFLFIKLFLYFPNHFPSLFKNTDLLLKMKCI